MLDSSFQFEIEFGEQWEKYQPYNLTLKRDATWKNSKRRLLVLFQSVDGRDLKAQELLGDRGTKTAFINSYKFARKTALPYTKEGHLPEYSLAVANFNAFRHLHLKSPSKRREAELVFADRCRQLIKKLEPTHILISGDEAMHTIFPSVEYPQYKRGWVHNIKVNGNPCKVTSTVDFSRLLEKKGQYANLFGYYTRHLANLMLGRNPHDLSGIELDPQYVKTRKDFDHLMAEWDRCKEVGIDTETKNLSSLHNKIYTMQFAFDHSPNTGYVLAIDHPLAQWTKDDRLYIKRELRKRFGAPKGPLVLMFNGHMFDLRVIRRALKLPFMWLPVWEIGFAEHELDENNSLLNDTVNMADASKGGKKSSFGGLAPILCSYGNDHYYTAKFGKGERDSLGSIDPSDPEAMKYMAMDVVSLINMKREQIRRASMMRVDGQEYKPMFLRHMRHQMSDAAHALSHMRDDGSPVSRTELRHLMGTESPMVKERKRVEGQLKIYKEVRRANSELLAKTGFKAGGLFSKTKENWIFKMSKPEHKKKLFLDVLGLEPISTTETGEPAIDKAFINFYKDKNKIVGLYGEQQAISKLMSTYVKGWYKRLQTNLDESTDNALRADYFLVDTGRLGSSRPNLQQIPSRGPMAKILKSLFVARPGYVQVQFDYSAHEVRMWGVTANDKVICETFAMGQRLRQAYILDPSDENRKAVKEKGDVHILNVQRFFGKVVDKNHPLRHAIKAVVFGVIYGKGADTLGEDTKQNDLAELKDAIGKLYDESLTSKDAKRLAEVNAQMEELDLRLTELLAEDRAGYAQDIMDKMFGQFKAGKRWIDKMAELAEREYLVVSPNGRVRHLYAAMTGDKQIVAQQVRRGSNAPIQGIASEGGCKAARMILEGYYKNLKIFKEQLGITKKDWDLRIHANRAVHDALYFDVPYEMLIPFLHICQYQATYGVARAYEQDFGMKFHVEPEIEMDIGVRGDHMETWDWSIPSLKPLIDKAVKEAAELKIAEGTYDEIMTSIMAPWKNKECRTYLQEHFPLLGVKDARIIKQIREAVA